MDRSDIRAGKRLQRSKWFYEKGQSFTVTVGALFWGFGFTILNLLVDAVLGEIRPIWEYGLLLIIASIIGLIVGYFFWIMVKKHINSAQPN